MNSTRPDFASATVEDLAADPHKFGCPTFEEFAMLRQQYFSQYDEAMASLGETSKLFGDRHRTTILQINGSPVSAEHLETRLADEGYTHADINESLKNKNARLKKTVQLVDVAEGKYDVVVNFIP